MCTLYIFLTLKSRLRRNVKSLGIGLWGKTVTSVESYTGSHLEGEMRLVLSEAALLSEAARLPRVTQSKGEEGERDRGSHKSSLASSLGLNTSSPRLSSTCHLLKEFSEMFSCFLRTW